MPDQGRPHRDHQPARAVALFGAPMPLGLGRLRPPTPRVRSHDAAKACGANCIAPESPRGRKKVAQSGSIWAFFEHPYTWVGKGDYEGPRHRSLVGLSSVIVPVRFRSMSSERLDGRPFRRVPSLIYDIRADRRRPRRPVAGRCPGEPGTYDFLSGARLDGPAETRSP
jgi:hypothetical protein